MYFEVQHSVSAQHRWIYREIRFLSSLFQISHSLQSSRVFQIHRYKRVPLSLFTCIKGWWCIKTVSQGIGQKVFWKAQICDLWKASGKVLAQQRLSPVLGICLRRHNFAGKKPRGTPYRTIHKKLGLKVGMRIILRYNHKYISTQKRRYIIIYVYTYIVMPIYNGIPPSLHTVIQTYLHTIIDISRRRYASAYNYKSDRYNQGTASLHP